jgi:hypothetical protein
MHRSTRYISVICFKCLSTMDIMCFVKGALNSCNISILDGM